MQERSRVLQLPQAVRPSAGLPKSRFVDRQLRGLLGLVIRDAALQPRPQIMPRCPMLWTRYHPGLGLQMTLQVELAMIVDV